MRLEITLSEVQQFLSNKYHIDIDLKNTEEDKIEATYIDSVVLIINEVKESVVLFHYEVEGIATIVTKIAHFFLKKKLDNSPIEWDSKNKELKIDLNQITELNTLIKFVSISEIHFIKDTIVLEMCARGYT
jgi:predicted restriction endonuclease